MWVRFVIVSVASVSAIFPQTETKKNKQKQYKTAKPSALQAGASRLAYTSSECLTVKPPNANKC